MMLRRLAVVLVASGLLAGSTQVTQAVSVEPVVSVRPAAVKYKFKNCAKLNAVYPHGVGKSGAVDKTSGKPVTTFKRSSSLYKKVIGYRKGLDRDHDGIACEKR